MIQQFAAYVMRDRKEATLMALLWTIIPFMGWVGVAIMALVTLRKGPREGLLILLWISLPNFILLFFGYLGPFFYGVICGSLIVWLLAIVLRETSSWGIVLQIAGIVACLGVVIAHGAIENLAAYWMMIINTTYKTSLVKALSSQLSMQEIDNVIKLISYVATGIQASLVLLINLLTLIVARWLQALLYNPAGLRKELCEVRLGLSADIVFLILIAAALMGSVIALDILPVVVTIFFITGLSLIHAMLALAASKNVWLWLTSFYGLLLLFFPYVASLTVMFAITDTIFDFRKKFSAIKE